MQRKIRVLVVDDSLVFRKILRDVLSEDPSIEVVGAAQDGREAVDLFAQLKPDVVVLDVEMPVMNGIETLKAIRKIDSQAVVVMCSALTAQGAAVTLHALTSGANDFVTKASNTGDFFSNREVLKRDLLPKIKVYFQKEAPQPIEPSRPAAPAGGGPAPAPQSGKGIELVAIGISTGGPNALMDLFAQFNGEKLAVPIVIVQHMPATFTAVFADRLAAATGLAVREAKEGDLLESGKIYLAPGDYHLVLAREGFSIRVRLNQDSPENFCRPAVDVLFRSVAELFGPSVLAVVMTGMGQDGMLGAERIKSRGGRVIVQDEASSVVWGMPGAVMRAGAAEAAYPLSTLAMEISRRVRGLA